MLVGQGTAVRIKNTIEELVERLVDHLPRRIAIVIGHDLPDPLVEGNGRLESRDQALDLAVVKDDTVRLVA